MECILYSVGYCNRTYLVDSMLYFYLKWIPAIVNEAILEILKPIQHITSAWLSYEGANHGTPIRTPALPLLRSRVCQPSLAWAHHS